MSESINKAMDKIRDEMTQTNHDAVTEIGEAMTRLLLASPELSDKILAEGKTCKGVYAAMEQYARKERKNCIPPRAAAKLIAEYWEIHVEAMTRAALEQEPQAPAGEPSSKSIKDSLAADGGSGYADSDSAAADFFSLLGGL